MIEDMAARKLNPHTQRGHISSMATSLQARAMLTLAYGCGLRAGEVVRLRAGDIDSEQMIIRVVQSKGLKSLPSRKRGIGT